ncbi:hypothetical protein D3C72_1450310 [compost metagenome]
MGVSWISLIGHCSSASSSASRLMPLSGSVGSSRAFMPKPFKVCMAPWKLGESTATMSPGSQVERIATDSASWQPVVMTISLAGIWQPESSARRATCSRSASVP